MGKFGELYLSTTELILFRNGPIVLFGSFPLLGIGCAWRMFVNGSRYLLLVLASLLSACSDSGVFGNVPIDSDGNFTEALASDGQSASDQALVPASATSEDSVVAATSVDSDTKVETVTITNVETSTSSDTNVETDTSVDTGDLQAEPETLNETSPQEQEPLQAELPTGNDAVSDDESPSNLPLPPINLRATRYSERQGELFWDSASDATNATRFEVWLDGNPVSVLQSKSIEINNLTENTEHLAEVFSIDASGVHSPRSLSLIHI